METKQEENRLIPAESLGGVLLMVAAVVAMLLVNSPLSHLYDALLDIPVAAQFGSFKVAKPLLLWINDGLMAIFFLLVGLEIKREMLEGGLANLSQIGLPAFGAAGGMVAPAVIYVAINYNDPVALNGWAIPTATDIAFALGILSLLGDRVPGSLKIFLMALAILDDLAAIVIIALFYSVDLSYLALTLGGAAVIALITLNRLHVTNIAAYAAVGTFLWLCVLKSGVHATLAGVVVAMAIPLTAKNDKEESPLRQLEHDLHPFVTYCVLPLFAFANAGVPLGMVTWGDLFGTAPLGIMAGLLVGKSLGVFGFVWLAVKSGLATLPQGMSWGRLFGVALLCGVGFTMSLFIGSLAFEHLGEEGADLLMVNRLGVLIGSFVSAVAGYTLLRFLLGKGRAEG